MQPPTMQPMGQAHVMGATEGMVTMSTRPAKMMNMMDAAITCLQKFAVFKGRASRSEYWGFFLFSFIAGFITGIIDAILFGFELTDPTPITWALQIGLFLPSLAAGIRRIHDHGHSGWLILIPIYNIFLLASEGETVPNIYGPVPTNIREGNSGIPYVIVQQPITQYQQPVQQQYQQPVQQQYQQPVQHYRQPPQK